MAPKAAIAAMGPRKRLSCSQSFAHRLATGLAAVDSGPPFNNFVGMGVPNAVGNGMLTFTDVNNGSFTYMVNTTMPPTMLTKAITRYDLGTGPQVTCTYSTTTPNFAAAKNYQDLWWVPNGAESGWGANFAHQGDSIFATWYTYNILGGTPLWLSPLTLRQGTERRICGADLSELRTPLTPMTPRR